jgi:hypothetical protein
METAASARQEDFDAGLVAAQDVLLTHKFADPLRVDISLRAAGAAGVWQGACTSPTPTHVHALLLHYTHQHPLLPCAITTHTGPGGERLFVATIRKCNPHQSEHLMVTDKKGHIIYATRKVWHVVACWAGRRGCRLHAGCCTTARPAVSAC